MCRNVGVSLPCRIGKVVNFPTGFGSPLARRGFVKQSSSTGCSWLRMQTNILLFEYSNTEHYTNSNFDIRVFVRFN